MKLGILAILAGVCLSAQAAEDKKPSSDMQRAIAFERYKDLAAARQARKEAKSPTVHYKTADREAPRKTLRPIPANPFGSRKRKNRPDLSPPPNSPSQFGRIGDRGGPMERRQFLRAGLAGLALSRGYAEEFADTAPKRVGLIGCGWYGKSDLFRLVQIAPVEIVSLCDVDKKNAGGSRRDWAVRARHRRKSLALYTDYREMLKEKDLDMVEIATPDHWHALPMIEAAQRGNRHVCAEAHQRGRRRRPGHAGRGPEVQARRADRHPASQHAAPDRSTRPSSSRASSATSDSWRSTATTACGRAGNPPDTAPVRSTSIGKCGPAPRPCGRTTPMVHPRGWRAFMEYGNGIVGRHGHPHVRHGSLDAWTWAGPSTSRPPGASAS